MDKRVAIVTGGAQGIGKSIVGELAADHDVVVIADIADDEAKNTIDSYCTEKCLIEYRKCDLTVDDSVESMVEGVIRDHGGIDSLVCNAGIQIRHWATEFPMSDFDRLFSLNLRAYYLCARTVARHMNSAGKGSIVCISSVNGLKYHSKRSAYNISKAAINGMVGTLAVEWGRFCTRINAVAPGYVETEVMLSGIREGLIDVDKAISIIPMKRFIKPEEIGKVVRFLLSDEASAITGQVLCVDGGWSVNALPEDKDMV